MPAYRSSGKTDLSLTWLWKGQCLGKEETVLASDSLKREGMEHGAHTNTELSNAQDVGSCNRSYFAIFTCLLKKDVLKRIDIGIWVFIVILYRYFFFSKKTSVFVPNLPLLFWDFRNNYNCQIQVTIYMLSGKVECFKYKYFRKWLTSLNTVWLCFQRGLQILEVLRLLKCRWPGVRRGSGWPVGIASTRCTVTPSAPGLHSRGCCSFPVPPKSTSSLQREVLTLYAVLSHPPALSHHYSKIYTSYYPDSVF